MLLRLTPTKRSSTVGDVAEGLGWSLDDLLGLQPKG